MVVLNQFAFDTEEEINLIRDWCHHRNVPFGINNAYARGGEGARDAAELIVQLTEEKPAGIHHTYSPEDSIENKIQKVATTIYGADGIFLEKKARQKVKEIQKLGLSHLPVCIAKTQYSFTDTPDQVHEYHHYTITVDDLLVNSGAGFIVAVCGEMMRMPGLPENPAAMNIDLVNGQITGLA